MNRFTQPQGKLGFGLMRLPRNGLRTDIAQTSQMVDDFLNAGFTYFDTAPVYPGSEAAAKKALVDRYDRDRYQLATKLNVFVAPTAASAKKQFDKSLERTGAGFFDYYLMHGLMDSNVNRYERFRIWDFVQEKKQKGLVGKAGFSFHGGPALLDRLLTEHPETDFVQLQINYMDWERPSVTSRENYEVARRHNTPIIVMEPVKGGTLAKPAAQVRELLHAYSEDASYASWALRFVGSLEGIHMILSGMSNIEQMRDNIVTMKDFVPLNDDERAIITRAQAHLGKSAAIDCTGCGYCLEGCPKKIHIPAIFSAANLQLASGQLEEARAAYATAVQDGHGPDACIDCGKCEKACPQHLPVRSNLQKAKQTCAK